MGKSGDLAVISQRRRFIAGGIADQLSRRCHVGSSGIYPRLAPQPIAGRLLADRPDRADD